MKSLGRCRWIWALALAVIAAGCASTGGEVVTVTEVRGDAYKDLGDPERQDISDFRRTGGQGAESNPITGLAQGTPNFTVNEYLKMHPEFASSAPGDYCIGGYDILKIVVYGESDLSAEAVRVSGEGYLTFPLVGQIKVDGLSTSQAEQLIARKLAEGGFLISAQVTIMVVDYGSKTYTVLGAVKKPGSYPLKARERLFDAISSAGGLEVEDAGKTAMIIRSGTGAGGPGQTVVININLEGLLTGADQISNVYLADKDVLYIPKAELVYVMGEVNRPGSYKLTGKDLTLIEVIGMAGGFTPIAARGRVRVVRVENGTEKVFKVNVNATTKGGRKSEDIVIKPGDVVVVPESFF